MQCSGCGADIPVVGSVCPFRGRDKSDDKRFEWVKLIGGIIGLAIGFSAFDSFLASVVCFFPGYVVGAILGTVLTRTRKPSAPKPVSRPVHPQSNDLATDKLMQLKRMHEQGLLTAEEFAKKKAEILDKL